MALRAKFHCQTVAKHAYAGQKDVTGEEAILRAVYAPDGENRAWSKATPAGELKITISNPDALGFFIPGYEYYLDITMSDEQPES